MEQTPLRIFFMEGMIVREEDPKRANFCFRKAIELNEINPDKNIGFNLVFASSLLQEYKDDFIHDKYKNVYNPCNVIIDSSFVTRTFDTLREAAVHCKKAYLIQMEKGASTEKTRQLFEEIKGFVKLHKPLTILRIEKDRLSEELYDCEFYHKRNKHLERMVESFKYKVVHSKFRQFFVDDLKSLESNYFTYKERTSLFFRFKKRLKNDLEFIVDRWEDSDADIRAIPDLFKSLYYKYKSSSLRFKEMVGTLLILTSLTVGGVYAIDKLYQNLTTRPQSITEIKIDDDKTLETVVENNDETEKKEEVITKIKKVYVFKDKIIQKEAKVYEKTAEDYVELAEKLEGEGKLEEAIINMNLALGLEDSFLYHEKLGDLFVKTGFTERAIKEYGIAYDNCDDDCEEINIKKGKQDLLLKGKSEEQEFYKNQYILYKKQAENFNSSLQNKNNEYENLKKEIFSLKNRITKEENIFDKITSNQLKDNLIIKSKSLEDKVKNQKNLIAQLKFKGVQLEEKVKEVENSKYDNVLQMFNLNSDYYITIVEKPFAEKSFLMPLLFDKDALYNNEVKQLFKESLNYNSDLDKAKLIFDWMEQYLDYDKIQQGNIRNKIPHIYRNAIETLKDRKGVCGELGFLYVTLARSMGLKSNYVLVDKDNGNKIVTHACAIVKTNGKYILVDPAYGAFDIKHKEYRILNDKELHKHFKRIR